MWALGSEEDCCTKLVTDMDESMKLLGAINAAFSASIPILNLHNIVVEKFHVTTGQTFIAALHWRDDGDFVHTSHGLNLKAMDIAMCDALAQLKRPSRLHVLLLGDISPFKLKALRHRIVLACPAVNEQIKLHTKTSLLPYNSELNGKDLGGDDIKGQVSSTTDCWLHSRGRSHKFW